jgi:hypothetical protein
LVDLGQLNGWLEQFVIGSTKEMQNVTGRLDRLVKELAPEPTPAPDGGELPAPARQGVASLVNQVHELMLEQKQRTNEDASTAQRVDNLLNQMVEDRNSMSSPCLGFSHEVGDADSSAILFQAGQLHSTPSAKRMNNFFAPWQQVRISGS